MEDGKRGMVNALRANPQDPSRTVRERIEGPAGSLRRGDAGTACQKTIAVPAGRGREVIETIRQGLERRWLRCFDQSAISLVHHSSPRRVLQNDQEASDDAEALRHQAADRGEPLVRLSHRRVPAEVQ